MPGDFRIGEMLKEKRLQEAIASQAKGSGLDAAINNSPEYAGQSFGIPQDSAEPSRIANAMESTPQETQEPTPDALKPLFGEPDIYDPNVGRIDAVVNQEDTKKLDNIMSTKEPEYVEDNKDKKGLFKTIGKGIGNFVESTFKGIVGMPVDMGAKEKKWGSAPGWQSYLGANLGKTLHDEAIYGKVQSGGHKMYNTEEERLKQQQANETAAYRAGLKENMKESRLIKAGIRMEDFDTHEQYVKAVRKKLPEYAAYLDKIAQGKVKVSGRGSEFMAKLWQDVASVHPDFDQAKQVARFSLKQAFTSGKEAQNIRSLNTATQHLGELYKNIDGMNNKQWKMYNRAKNLYLQETGDPAVDRFLATKQAVVSELLSLFKGSSGTDMEYREMAKAINEANSPEQLQAFIEQATHLMMGRQGALQYQWDSVMDDEPSNIVSPQSQKMIDRILANEFGTEADTKTNQNLQILLQEKARRERAKGVQK